MTAPTVTLHHGDARTVLADLAECSVHAIVTDPPYELTANKKGGTGPASLNTNSPAGRSRITTGQGGFMGKKWDATGIAHDPAFWAECLRVLKPGGHLLAFGGTRTWHRLAVAVEDAGFEIRDNIAWLYGSGFPKSRDVSKAIDKAAGAEREVVGIDPRYVGMSDKAKRAQGATTHEYSAGWVGDPSQVTAPATPEAVQWQGWGTALKPAFEPVVVARKPLTGTVAGNVLVHGTGALNIDGCRVETTDNLNGGTYSGTRRKADNYSSDTEPGAMPLSRKRRAGEYVQPSGRWPANVVLDESGVAALDNYGDSGGASRFFYVAKAPKKERPNVEGVAHPTVKPLTLMRWLIRLVTPPGGTILDPFAGSGTTAEAALTEGFHYIGIDSDPIALAMIRVRLHRQILTLDRYTGPESIPTVTHPGDPTLFDQETV